MQIVQTYTTRISIDIQIPIRCSNNHPICAFSVIGLGLYPKAAYPHPDQFRTLIKQRKDE